MASEVLPGPIAFLKRGNGCRRDPHSAEFAAIAELVVSRLLSISSARNLVEPRGAVSANNIALIVYLELDHHLALSSMAPDLKSAFAGVAPGQLRAGKC